jgi:hypothetical protein
VWASIDGKGDVMGILDEAKNAPIEDEAITFLNFDEKNPFGDP